MNSGAFRRFCVATLKLGSAIVAAVLVLALLAWAIVAVRERSQEAANAPLATVKKWPETRLNAPFTDTTFRLQTVWRNGNIYYQFGIEGYPPVFRQASGRESQSAFQINFLDKDGFQLYQRQVTLAEMTKVVGDDDQPTGELWKSNEAMDVDLYRRAAKWRLHGLASRLHQVR